MPHYLNEYDLVSDLTLPVGVHSVEIKPDSAMYRATISEASSQGDTATLFVRIFFDAETIEEAEEKGKSFSVGLVQGLAIATSARFDRPRLKRIIDWTQGIEVRQAAVYMDAGQLSNPHPVLDQGIADGVSRLLHEELQPHVKNALGWYRDGVLGVDPDKKVHAYWLALETLVGGMQWQERVADQCKKCRAELYCQTCQKISTHRPFPAQKVRLLLRDVINDDDVLFNEAVEARHTLMHGGTLIGSKDSNPYPYNDMIERLARAARRCVTREMMFAKPQEGAITVLEPSSYLHKTFRFKSDCFVTVPLQEGKLLPENIPATNITLTREEGMFVLQHEAIGDGRVDLGGFAKGASDDGQ